jgi:hypothetical protein
MAVRPGLGVLVQRDVGGPPRGDTGSRIEHRGGRATVAVSAAPDVRAGPQLGLGRRTLGGVGQEALQVTQAEAAVAPGVDPVVAQPAGIAPRPDRIRVDAQDMRSSRDGERRVGWARMQLGGVWHRSPREDL